MHVRRALEASSKNWSRSARNRPVRPSSSAGTRSFSSGTSAVDTGTTRFNSAAEILLRCMLTRASIRTPIIFFVGAHPLHYAQALLLPDCRDGGPPAPAAQVDALGQREQRSHLSALDPIGQVRRKPGAHGVFPGPNPEPPNPLASAVPPIGLRSRVCVWRVCAHQRPRLRHTPRSVRLRKTFACRAQRRIRRGWVVAARADPVCPRSRPIELCRTCSAGARQPRTHRGSMRSCF